MRCLRVAKLSKHPKISRMTKAPKSSRFDLRSPILATTIALGTWLVGGVMVEAKELSSLVTGRRADMRTARNEVSDANAMNYQPLSLSKARIEKEKMFSSNGVSIELPAEATLQKVSPTDERSQVKVAVDRDEVTYSIVETDAPSDFMHLNQEERRAAFEVARAELLEDDNVIDCQLVEVEGFPGLDLWKQEDKEMIRKQLFVVGKKLYILEASKEGAFTKQVEQFFNSFKINPEEISSMDSVFAPESAT